MPQNYQPRKKGPGRKPVYHKPVVKGKMELIDPSKEPSGTKLERKVFEKTIGIGHPR